MLRNFASLAETFPSIDWAAFSVSVHERVGTHGLRRAAKMREAAAMLAEIGAEPHLTEAVADAQERGVRGDPAAVSLAEMETGQPAQ